MFLQGMVHHDPTSLRYDAFPLLRSVDPLAWFRFVLPCVQAIIQDPSQGILIPDPKVIALVIDKSQ